MLSFLWRHCTFTPTKTSECRTHFTIHSISVAAFTTSSFSHFITRLKLDMDFSESTKVVVQRIQKLDPENVSKIIGSLLLEENPEHEMRRLAFAPDTIIRALIEKGKQNLSPKFNISNHVSAPQGKHSSGLSLSKNFTPFTPSSSSNPFYPVAAFPADNGKWIPQITIGQPVIPRFEYGVPVNFVDPAFSPHYQVQFSKQFGSCNLAGPYVHAPLPCVELAKQPRPDKEVQGSPEYYSRIQELPVPVCEHFKQGFCKHGGLCKYLHVLQIENGYIMVLNPPGGKEMMNYDCGPIKQLEIELIEILKDRRGIPVPISSLPILYNDKYGMILQPEKYLGDGHRQQHMIGCSLILLISKMAKNIATIDRPQGQKCVLLVEDIPLYVRFMEELNGSVEMNGNEVTAIDMRQVYLTFPPGSTFSDQDVYNYFNKFGPVRDVRIPRQEKKMFGFVTFFYYETVVLVLTVKNPHFIRGAQIMVKPYRPRPMLVDRKPEEKILRPTNDSSCFPNAESRLPSTSNLNGNVRSSKKPPVTNQNEPKVDLAKTRILKRDVTTTLSHETFMRAKPYHGSNAAEGVSSNGCASEVQVNHIKVSNYVQESCSHEEINLPDSPFSFENISPFV